MNQPAAYINLAVYEDSVEYLGVAKVKLPDITYPCVEISGAGMMGKMEIPLYGMVDSMSMSLDFLSATQSLGAVKLAAPTKHQLELRVAEEYWDVEEAEVGVWADKFVVLGRPKTASMGNITPMSAADTSVELAIYYYAAWKGVNKLWEIDKRNMKCYISGRDYMEDVRKALGK